MNQPVMNQPVPNHPVTGIDHVFLLTADLDAAAADWSRLGFTVTPRGFHSEHMGSANHTIMLEEDYVELLGILRATPHNAGHRARLEGGEGLHAIACRIADARAAVEALASLGVATTGEVLDFERPVDLPGGRRGTAAFSVATFAPGMSPRGHVFMCEHRSRDAVWVPEWTTHANGARALAAIVARAADPAALAARYVPLFAGGSAGEVEGGVRVETGSAPILVLDDAGFAARYPGLDADATPLNGFAALEFVCDLDAARRALGAHAEPVPGGLAVAARHATGCILGFVARRP